MNIEITQDIIAKCLETDICPIKFVVRNRIHRPVIVGQDRIYYITSSGNRSDYMLDSITKTFITNWDNGKKVSPITINLSADKD